MGKTQSSDEHLATSMVCESSAPPGSRRHPDGEERMSTSSLNPKPKRATAAGGVEPPSDLQVGRATTIGQNVNPDEASEEKAPEAAGQGRWYVTEALVSRRFAAAHPQEPKYEAQPQAALATRLVPMEEERPTGSVVQYGVRRAKRGSTRRRDLHDRGSGSRPGTKGGCYESRRSTSGTFEQSGSHPIDFTCSMQHVIALSSREAELYATARPAAGGLQSVQLLAEAGLNLKLEVLMDSTAHIGTDSRIGSELVRKLDVRWLWTQEAAHAGRVSLKKVGTVENVRDLTTKCHDAERLGVMFRIGGLRLTRGLQLAALVPPAVGVSQSPLERPRIQRRRSGTMTRS